MNCKKRNHEEPLRIASAIVTLVSNLHKSKCNTFHKLARARVMKFCVLAKANKTNRWLANATRKKAAICKSNRVVTTAASHKSDET